MTLYLALLFPAKPAMKDSQNLTFDRTSEVINDLQIEFRHLFGKFMLGAINDVFGSIISPGVWQIVGV